jgi:hypothetical protein
LNEVGIPANEVFAMARGRFWSQEHLQEELNKLTTQQKQQNLNHPRNIDTEVLDFSPHH